MTDHSITGLMAIMTGATVFVQANSINVPLPWNALVAVIGMAAAALITWGMFRKATEQHQEEISLLKEALSSIDHTLADVRERVARIEGKLEGRGRSSS